MFSPKPPDSNAAAPAEDRASRQRLAQKGRRRRNPPCARSCSAPTRWPCTGKPSQPRTGWLPDHLLDRLAANENALVEVCKLLTAAVAQGRQIRPAGEWLLDNFYLIEEQIRTAKRHLPEGYSREFPRLAQGRMRPCSSRC